MLAVGGDFVVACLVDGVLRAWGGDNTYGQLNIPEDIGVVKHISAGDGFVVATREDGTVVAWGRNDSGQTALPEGLTDVKYTVCGKDFAYAVKNDGSLVCWGCNSHCQLFVPEDVQAKGVKNLAVYNERVAIETVEGSLTTFDVM